MANAGGPPSSLTAFFTVSDVTGNAPLMVQFTDGSISGIPTSWKWDFGDGTGNSSEQNPVHTFEHSGTYTVTLTVSDGSVTSTYQAIDLITVAKRNLNVATDASYPPFEYNNGTGLDGFDIQLMNLIAQKLDVNVIYSNVSFGEIIPAVASGTYDCAISAFTITEPRREVIDFSNPYYHAGPGDDYGIVVSKSNPDLLTAINTALANIEADNTITNLRTGITYSSIQAAISDDNTTAGDTILVGSGTYGGPVSVSKAVSLIGVDTGSGMPRISGGQFGFQITHDGVTLQGFNVTNAMTGIVMGSNNNNVTGNTLTHNNGGGIDMGGSSYNHVTGNTVVNNTGNGISISGAHDNVFSQNVIRDNAQNVRIFSTGANKWNSTTPMAYTYNTRSFTNYTGNYWGGYTGLDADGDGIGDTQYAIDPNNVDYYPLILSLPALEANYTTNVAWGMAPLTVQFTDTSRGYLQISSWQWSFGDGTANVTTQNVTHTFTGPGNYTVTLTVTNGTLESSMSKTFRAVSVGNGDIVNTRTGLTFSSISAAISDANTTAGDTILVGSGTYGGFIGVGKAVSLIGVDTGNGMPQINGGMFGFQITHDGVTIQGFNVTNAMTGIVIGSNNNNVTGNTLTHNNGGGIDMGGSSYNHVTGNTVINNTNSGISISGAHDNVFSQNIIRNNGQNVRIYSTGANKWNSTMPMDYTYKGHSYTDYVGNYWGGYTGLDADNNGIGDSPLTIDGSNADYYPMLVGPTIWANFSANVTSGMAPLTVQFTDASVGATSWEWNFGDSSANETTQNATHMFNGTGNYTVTLTVSSGSQTDTTSATISVYVPNTIHVPLDYSTIQAAVNAANPGDTINVDSGTYLENVVVNKSISLIGVDTGSSQPVVNGQDKTAITLNADGATVHGFTVTTNGATNWDNTCEGIDIKSNSNNVTGNTVNGCWDGIHIYFSNNSVVSGNTASDNVNGIEIAGSYNTVSGNTANNNTLDVGGSGILISYGSDNTVSGNTANDNGDEGIYIYYSYSDNNTVSGNTANNNGDAGIYIDYSDNNIVAGNTANNNFNDGIYIASSTNINVSGNTANNNYNGIDLSELDNATVTGNTVNNNSNLGISLYGCQRNILRTNTMSGNMYNFADYLYSSYIDDVDMSNLIDGRPIYYLVGASDIVVDDATGTDTVYLINCNNVTVRNLTLNHNGFGVFARDSANCLIQNNTLSNNYYGGVYLYNTNNSVIAESTANNNSQDGIYMESSNNNTVTGNTANYCSNIGIDIHSSNNNNVSGNIVNNNAYCGIGLLNSNNYNNVSGNTANNEGNSGIILDLDSCNNTVTANTASNNSYDGIMIRSGSNNNTVAGNTVNYNYDGVLLHSSNNATVTGNTANNNSNIGVELYHSNGNNVSGNIVNNNTQCGIGLYYSNNYNNVSGNTANGNGNSGIILYVDSNNNNVSGNTAYNNSNSGVFVESSTGNVIWLNVFSNTVNAKVSGSDENLNYWNSSTPMDYVAYNGRSFTNYVGNYWSNYRSTDVDNDGIWDTSYPIASNNVDYYPMLPGAPLIAGLTANVTSGITPLTVQFTDTSTGTHTSWNWSFGDGTANVTTQNVTHTFNTRGNYTVTLTVRSGILTDTTSATIKVMGVFNTRTGLGYSSIQAAIDDANTTNGDTIEVHSGTYVENVNISKPVSLIGVDTGDGQPVVNGGGNTYGNTAITLSADDVILQGFNVTNAYYGIDVLSSRNTLTGNTANNMYDGIYFDEDSNNNTVTGNTANNNGDIGIYIYVNSNNNTVTGNTANNNSYAGIYILENSNNTVTGNTANDNLGYGIIIDNCSYNVVSGSTANNNRYGGIYLCDNSNNNTVTGNTANNNDDGIYIEGGSNNVVSGNSANNNYAGIYLEDGSNNVVSGNMANNNIYGIKIWNNLNTTISGNTANNNGNGIDVGKGIDVGLCSNSNISTNTANNNGEYGIYFYSNSNNNTVSGNSVSYNGHGICFVNSNDNTVLGNVVSHNTRGIWFESSNGNIVSGNAADHNLLGIYVVGSNNNVSGNTANYNNRGIYFNAFGNNIASGNTANNNTVSGILLQNTAGNVLWLNTMSGNGANGQVDGGGVNYWNSSTPVDYTFNGRTFTNYVGNYWSDYTGVDADHDGIGDASYLIGTSNVDYYPMLMVVPLEANFSANVTSGYAPLSVQFTDASFGSLDSWNWSFGDGTPNSTEQSPVHKFNYTGNYTVTLTVINGTRSSSASLNVSALGCDARYVSDTIPGLMMSGQSYNASITLKNTGSLAWDGTNIVRLYSAGGSTGDALKYFGVSPVNVSDGTTVNPGDEYTFTFTMKAPSTAGTYNPQFRAMWYYHYWFGDTVNKTVTVAQAFNSQYVNDTIPGSMITGQSYNVSVTVRNTGATPWNSTNIVKLYGVNGSSGDALKYFGVSPIMVTDGVTVNPGDLYTFTFTMKAPSTMGTYNPSFQPMWYMHNWFGDKVNKTVTVAPMFNAQYVNDTVPGYMVTGQSYNVSITLKNTGATPWDGTNIVKLYGVNGSTGDALKYFGVSSVSIPDGTTVNPGNQYTFTFTMKAPSTAGTYNPGFQPMLYMHNYFGDKVNKTVTVAQAFNAQYLSDTIPGTMTVGQSYNVSVTVKNTGATPWNSTNIVKLYGVNGTSGDAGKYFGVNSVSITSGVTVNPGDTYTFTFTMRAPSTAGTYNPSFQAMWYMHYWFGDKVNKTVTVSAIIR